MNYKVQETYAVKVLRTNDNLSLGFTNNGVVLFQAIDKETGAVSPDWTIPENQPVRTPQVSTTQGVNVVFTMHKYLYNGHEIDFEDQPVVGGWMTEKTHGRFQLRPSDGSIRIVKNLASLTNYADDTLSYKCQVSIGGVEYNMSAEMTIAIQQMGASSFYGSLLGSATILSDAVSSMTLQSFLYLGAHSVSDYSVVWHKGLQVWTDKTGKTITVHRDDVDASQLIGADFVVDGKVVAKAWISIRDEADEFKLIPQITSANKAVVPPYRDSNGVLKEGTPIELKFQIVNMRTKAEVTPVSATYESIIIDKDSWDEIRRVNSNVVTVTPQDCEIDGVMADEVLVDCSAEFTI